MKILKSSEIAIAVGALGLLVFGMTAFADAAAPSLLETNMKQIGGDMKQINLQVNDATKNQNSAALADDVLNLFKALLSQIPDAVATMPADQQAAATADYQRLINDEVTQATALEQAFLNNDNAGAVAILQKMNSDKADGHNEFNP